MRKTSHQKKKKKKKKKKIELWGTLFTREPKANLESNGSKWNTRDLQARPCNLCHTILKMGKCFQKKIRYATAS